MKTEEKIDLHQFASEAATSYAWSMVFGTDADAFNFFKVGAIHTKPFMRVIYVDVLVSRLELLARHLGTVVKRAYGDAFDVSSVFKVHAILTTLNMYLQLSHEPILDRYI